MPDHVDANFVDDRAEQLLAMTRRLVVLVDEEIEAVQARKLDASSGCRRTPARLPPREP